MFRPLHIVQVGYDDTVFVAGAPSDTLLRQKVYAQLLAKERPGSRMTILVLTQQSRYQPMSDGPVTFIPVTGRGVLRLLRLLGQLFSLNKERKIDVIATQTIFADAWVALAFAAVMPTKVIGQIHFDIFSPFSQTENLGGRTQARWRLALALRLLHYLCVVRVVSQRLRSEILTRGLHSYVVVIPVPVTMLATTAPSFSREAKRVLYVGRLAVEKNLWLWLRVAHRIHQQEPDVEFEWAGDGQLRAVLLADAERLGLSARLRCLGWVPYDRLPAIYGRATVLLLTSYYEGFGRVLVEAGWHGLPVVAPRLTGVEDIVSSGETGFVCPPGDEVGLADAVLSLLRDPALCTRMGAAAQARMKLKFDPQQLAEQWVEILISAVEAQA